MRSQKRKKTWIKVTLIVFALLLIGGGAYAFTVYQTLNKAVETMNEPIDREKSTRRVEEVKFEELQPFSMLLLGVDERENDVGRSDTIIVVTVNPNEESIKMLSIPRDTRVDIVGQGTVDKINHAYAFGGVDMSMNTVENFLDIPIDYYMKINMEGFLDIVNAVGGVTVDNELQFSNAGYDFPVGEVTLKGEEALAFARMRYDDPRGDFGRQERQRQMIESIIKEGASLSSLWNFDDIFAAIGSNVKTNLTFEQMIDIQQNYKRATNDITQDQIAGSGTRIDGIYYYIVPEEERIAVQNELKAHLELDAKPVQE